MSCIKKHVRTLQERLMVIEEIERNPAEKRIDIAKRLGIAPSTLNSIFSKRSEIREQIKKCGSSCKKRKSGKESSYPELENVLFAWYQQTKALNVSIDGSMLRAKAKEIAAEIGVINFTASNGWVSRFKERHGLMNRKVSDESTPVESSYPELESILFSWYQQANALNLPIDGDMLREKAKEIAVQTGVENFKASNSWVSQFKLRHGIVYKKVSGESTAIENNTTDMWIEDLPLLLDGYDTNSTDMWIEDLPLLLEGYDPSDIYNAQETGLFYNALPEKTLTLKGESCHDGKSSKERLTVLLCANSDGSDKLMPIVIGKSTKPRCFKNVKKLPVEYHANKKAWMTVDIFTCFLCSIDAKMRSQNRNILLFVDNCAAHPQDISFLKNVKVARFPANNTSVLQPLNLGAVKSFKQKYRKQLVHTAVFSMETGKDKAKIDVLQALHFIVTAWQDVKAETINNCFTKASFRPSEPSEDNQTASDEVDDSFQDNWNKFFDVNFEDYVAIDNNLTTSGVTTVEDLCTDQKQNHEKEEEEDEDDSESVPSFSEAYEALTKLKSFMYAHSDSDSVLAEVEAVERSFFALRQSTSTNFAEH